MAEKTTNEEFLDAMLRHQAYLLRYSDYVRNRILAVLERTEEDLVDKIRSRLAINTGLTTPTEWKRLAALVESIRKLRGKAWDRSMADFEDQMTNLAKFEPVQIGQILTLTLPVQISVVMPSVRLLKSIATARPFEGQLLRDWAEDMEADDLRRISNAIKLGMTAGEDMDTIARRVTGSARLGGADGVLNMTRAQVQAVTRTAVMSISNSARTEFFEANSDIINAEYFVATLDSRTTPICRSLDGQTFELGKGPRPPLHFNCRSLRVAAIDGILAGERPAKPFTERQLVREYAEANNLGNINDREGLPHGTKTDFDSWSRKRIRQIIGPIPAKTTYQEWLKGQSTSFQNDILGHTKAKLFRDGGLTLDKFVNRNGGELSLKQLAITEAEAFRAAGLDPADF